MRIWILAAILFCFGLVACSGEGDASSSTSRAPNELSAAEKKRLAAIEAAEKNVVAMLEASKVNNLQAWRACFTRASQPTVVKKKHTPPVKSYKILSSKYLENGEVEVRAEQTSRAGTPETYTWTLKEDNGGYRTYLMKAKIADQEIVINSESRSNN